MRTQLEIARNGNGRIGTGRCYTRSRTTSARVAHFLAAFTQAHCRNATTFVLLVFLSRPMCLFIRIFVIIFYPFWSFAACFCSLFCALWHFLAVAHPPRTDRKMLSFSLPLSERAEYTAVCPLNYSYKSALPFLFPAPDSGPRVCVCRLCCCRQTNVESHHPFEFSFLTPPQAPSVCSRASLRFPFSRSILRSARATVHTPK